MRSSVPSPATEATSFHTLSLHDALPICGLSPVAADGASDGATTGGPLATPPRGERSEEHTSELQSSVHLVCRLLLAKKKFDAVVGTFTHHRAKIMTLDRAANCTNQKYLV